MHGVDWCLLLDREVPAGGTSLPSSKAMAGKLTTQPDSPYMKLRGFKTGVEPTQCSAWVQDASYSGPDRSGSSLIGGPSSGYCCQSGIATLPLPPEAKNIN